MEQKNTGSARRKDYVTTLAFLLFGVILLLEMLLVTWLPSELSSEKLWDRQVSLQEMIDLEDFLRSSIRSSLKYQNTWEEGEGGLAIYALDILARYIRQHQDDLTREQIQEVYSTLKKVETHYINWNKGKFYIVFEDIKIGPVLNKQLDDYRDWMKKNEPGKN